MLFQRRVQCKLRISESMSSILLSVICRTNPKENTTQEELYGDRTAGEFLQLQIMQGLQMQNAQYRLAMTHQSFFLAELYFAS